MAAIRLHDLRKTYTTDFWKPSFEAVRGISLEVSQGEAFGFVGPNGAGKTSTIKILAGLQDATSGEAFINGVPCTNHQSRQHLGFLPERPYFYTHLTANEVLSLSGSLFGMKGTVLRSRIQELLKRTDMTRFADVSLGKYSKGMLQRIGLCQTLLHDPEVILLDEPMSGLDPVGRAMVRDIILEERAAGRTVFFCSHVLSDVESICERVAILVRGQIQVQGRIEDLVVSNEKQMTCVFTLSDGASTESLTVPSMVEIQSKGGLYEVVLAEDDFAHFLKDNLNQVSIVDVHVVRKSLEDLLVDAVSKAEGNEGSDDHRTGQTQGQRPGEGEGPNGETGVFA